MKPLSDQQCGRYYCFVILKVFNSDNSYMFSLIENPQITYWTETSIENNHFLNHKQWYDSYIIRKRQWNEWVDGMMNLRMNIWMNELNEGWMNE